MNIENASSHSETITLIAAAPPMTRSVYNAAKATISISIFFFSQKL